ncbi:M23 family metallopeptidase [Candidatus Babeliales bacterium]|nr:M23 family metallopeptidase [Candidatus Babeliales bacterium]
MKWFSAHRLYLFILLISTDQLMARRSHMCFNSNESVVKFRKKTLGDSYGQAIKMCLADKIIGKKTVSFDWPVDLCDFWVSSLFGMRKHKGAMQHHGGIDMAAFKGVSVKAAAAGVVTRAQEEQAGYGTLIEIKHAYGYTTRYGHLDEMFVQEGTKVAQGEVIGAVGSTGRVRAKRDPSHLHFEILHHGVKVNPLKYLYCSEVAFD